MKTTLTTTVLVALATITSVQGAAVASTCNQPGGACAVLARALTAFDDALKHHADKRWICQCTGNICKGHAGCFGKRDEDDVGSEGQEWDDVLAQTQDKRWCQAKGEACNIARGTAAAVLDVLTGGLAARGADLAEPFDHAARVKRDPCFGAQGECTKAERDLKAMEMVARSILEEQ
jgi:hypothetical protein